MRIVVLAVLCTLGGVALAQSTAKCQDKNGRIVYVDRDCEVYGLRSLGAVQDRVTVAPAKPSSQQDEDPPAPAGRQRAMQACRADAQKFCRGVKAGSGGIMDCLIDHQNDISDDCYEILKEKLKSEK